MNGKGFTLGRYFEHLRKYADFIERGQLRIYLFEDFAEDTAGVTRDIFGYAGADRSFIPDVSFRQRKGGTQREDLAGKMVKNVISNPFVGKVAKRLAGPFTTSRERFMLRAKAENITVQKAGLPGELREELINRYRDDIIKLQKLIKRDLSNWLEVE
ncbi:MAG: hypothetical protein GF392_06150 [Candidatus Omnitrophica bacterium]|nr:hypothetical protein [Candidatus Omnitrophota bacterium]